MRTVIHLGRFWLYGILASCAIPHPATGGTVNSVVEELVTLERSALDRWIQLDPQGYLDAAAPEITYFDPTTERRVDGWEVLQMRLAPMNPRSTGDGTRALEFH